MYKQLLQKEQFTILPHYKQSYQFPTYLNLFLTVRTLTCIFFSAIPKEWLGSEFQSHIVYLLDSFNSYTSTFTLSFPDILWYFYN